jgi:hypothetical protein
MMNFRLIVALSVLLFASGLYAQNVGDTITVNAINYNSLTRDTVVQFPDLPGVTFEKILMQYNMRCHGGGVNNTGGNNWGPNGSNACGEWDYKCNTYVHDSTRIDSILYKQPTHVISGFAGTTFNYTSQPLFDYYQYAQQQVVLNNIVSETQSQVLLGTSPMSTALAGTNQSGKAQYLYTATELTAAGVTPGDINGFLVNALNAGTVNFLRVNVKGTAAATLDATAPETTGFTEVYFSNYTFATGSNRIHFYTPFNWNGTDNVLIELSFTNTVAGSTIQLEGTASTDLGIYSNNGYYQNLASNGHIDIPAGGLSTISNEVTVSFWAYGDANQLPASTTIIEGVGAGGERDLNVHLPWSNSEVYWDCGGDGNYDRINQPAAVTALEGQWNHWAFVKNATTGMMEIYLNGSLWHSGTGLTRPIDIAQMIVGKSTAYSNNYKGSIDELRIWDKALTGADIQNWMNIPLNVTHPEYASLVAYYPFNEGTGTSINDASANAAVATSNGAPVWMFERGVNLERFFEVAANRPSITMVQGTYNTTVTPTNVLDSVQVVPNTVEEFSITSNPGIIMDDEVVTVSVTQVWEANPETIYDAATGAVISTIPVATEGTIDIAELDYYRRYPMKFEIMSFVTPYGINLNLGIDGKTWTFDMTDFTPILNGDKRLTIEDAGRWQEEMDINFLFIVGTPPADIVDIQQVWRVQQRGYTNILNDDYFAPRDVQTSTNGEMFKVRSAITGHGQEGEFIPRAHFVDINGGNNEFTWQVWKECGENPVFPQGGTWIYDRAGWCPGMATDVQHWDITSFVTPGQPVNIDYGVQTASGTSNYHVNQQMVTYGAPNHVLDAELVEVSQPSNRVEFDRHNSICNEPIVKIRNTGSTELTSLTIKYWVNDDPTPETYIWTGSLAFMEEEEVSLPSPLWLWNSTTTSNNLFYAEVSSPNGGIDEYEYNNIYSSDFEIPEVLPGGLIIWFRSNNAPSESSYQLTDDLGNVVFERSNFAPNTLYRDTVQLGIGCYQYRVYDTDDDGINFWANNDGQGYTRFAKIGGGIAKTFNGDFGDGIIFNFTVDFPLSYDEIELDKSVNVYPNPAIETLNVKLEGFAEDVELNLYNSMGQVVLSEKVKASSGAYHGSLSISELNTGIYILKITDGKKSTRVKVVKE